MTQWSLPRNLDLPVGNNSKIWIKISPDPTTHHLHTWRCSFGSRELSCFSTAQLAFLGAWYHHCSGSFTSWPAS